MARWWDFEGEAGKWEGVHTIALRKAEVFSPGSRVSVRAAFEVDDAVEEDNQFPEAGWKGHKKTNDESGDADVHFTRSDGTTFTEYVLKSQVHKVMLVPEPIAFPMRVNNMDYERLVKGSHC